MERLGLRRPIDLALHLPLRYEDETQVVRLRDARPGEVVQVEGVVSQCRVETARRRQLLVTLRDEEGQSLLLRFLHFYPTQQRAMAEGRRLRVRGELRGGFFGFEMVHPAVKDAEAPLAQSLTPVYPAGAGLPQAYLRKAIAAALPRAPLHELLPPDCLPPGLPGLRDALNYLHHPPPAASLRALLEHHHPAWQRLKFEELLAQQLSQLEAKQLRARHNAPALRGGALVEQLLATLPFQLTVAQRRVNEVREGDHVGRLGGDEFVVIAEPVANIEEAVGLAQRVVDVLQLPIEIGGELVVIAASVGVALATEVPLTADELDSLRIEVSILHSPEPVGSPGELDPCRYGVIIRAREGRQGLLLPGLAEVKTVEDQLALARRKGGISPQEPVELERFEVDHVP